MVCVDKAQSLMLRYECRWVALLRSSVYSLLVVTDDSAQARKVPAPPQI